MKFINSVIKDALVNELKPLCAVCIHLDDCEYYKKSAKAIIQCELFEEELLPDPDGKGLCGLCGYNRRCTLPGKKYGVWHCEEFK